MSENHQLLFINMVRSTLEEYAFMVAKVDRRNRAAPPYESCLQATTVFIGPICGELGITAPHSLCAEMAATLFAVELEAVDGAQERDVLKELVNVTCGAFIYSLCGNRVEFDVGIPTVREIGRAMWSGLVEKDESICFIVEKTPFLAHLLLAGLPQARPTGVLTSATCVT